MNARLIQTWAPAPLAVLACWCAAARCVAAEDLARPDVAVEAGARALGGSFGPPWYDAEADALKPLPLPAPPKPSPFWEWLADVVQWLFGSWGVELGELLQFLGWLLIAALAVWILLAVARAYRLAERHRVDADTEAEARADIARVEALPVDVDAGVTDLLAEARRLRERGDFARAVVYLFSHQLVQLDRHGLVRLAKGKTNRQYLREVARAPGAPAGLGPMIERVMLQFEAAFFGGRPPSAEAFEAAWAEVEPFHALLRQALQAQPHQGAA